MTRSDAWFLLKLAATASAGITLICTIALSPILIGLTVQHGHASALWTLGIPISLVPTLMLVALVDDWDPPWLR